MGLMAVTFENFGKREGAQMHNGFLCFGIILLASMWGAEQSYVNNIWKRLLTQN